MQVQELHTASILIEVKGKSWNKILCFCSTTYYILYGSSQLRHNPTTYRLDFACTPIWKIWWRKKVSQSTFLQHLQTCTWISVSFLPYHLKSFWVWIYISTIEAFFRQIKSFRRFRLAFGFGHQTFYLIDFS